MRLPPIDVHRAPFVEPIGHLAMQAAYADNELIELCGTVPFDGSPDNMTIEQVAHHLRNWGLEAQRFVQQRLDLIVDEDLRAQARECVERYTTLRQRRHRAVHDAIEIGLFETIDGYEVKPLGVEYKRNRNATSRELTMVTPESIADLACEMYDLQKDIEAVAYAISTTLP